MKHKKFKFKIDCQGVVEINHGIYIKKTKSICAVTLDLNKKWVEIDYTGGSNDIEEIGLIYNNSLTTISFPDMIGWRIFTRHISKYSLHICFIKKEI